MNLPPEASNLAGPCTVGLQGGAFALPSARATSREEDSGDVGRMGLNGRCVRMETEKYCEANRIAV